jgi:hypothetical protein
MSKLVATTADAKAFAERANPKYKYDELSVVTGRKYHKVVSESYGQRSVYAFIDNQGYIYKPATWAAPAKHARGNIFSPMGGLEALDAQGFIYYMK